MSRSIHDTWARLRKAARHRYADREVWREELLRIRRNIGKKQRIKEEVRKDRALDERPEIFAAPETIPVDVRDSGPGLFYPATVEDIRSVMRRLPPDAYSGVEKIVLCLGKEYMDERCEETRESEESTRDPLTGRRGTEFLPGLYLPPILGTWRAGATIFLYAYVRTREIPHRQVAELVLCLRMLSTLVHELAHHQDSMTRVARGRWRMDDEEKTESFATMQQERWRKEHVLPYLEEAHADEVEGLQRWLEHHGGMRVPITTLFGDESDSFPSFLRKVTAGATPPDSWVELARTLHRDAQHETSLALVERVLSEHPGRLDALILEAENLEGLGRYDAAFELARGVVALDPRQHRAWLLLFDHHIRRQDWTGVLREIAEAEQVKAGFGELPAEWGELDARPRRILALVNLHRIDEALAEIRSTPAEIQGRWVFQVLHAMALLAGGQDERALDVCVAALARARGGAKSSPAVRLRRAGMLTRLFEACRFVALARLGRAEARAYLAQEPRDDWPGPWLVTRFPELFQVWLPACRARLTT